MNCAVYVRKSNAEPGEKEPEKKSTAVQLTECREFAKARGWRVVEEYVDDAVSGAEFENRPALKRLLEAVNAPKLPFECLLMTERSRLARDTIRGLALFQTLADSGLEMWATAGRGERIALDNDTDEITEFIKGWAAKKERGAGRERSRRVKVQAAKAGRATGKRLFGYTKGWEIDPAEADIVRRMYTLRSSGLGFYRICRQLEREGISTPTGKKVWNISTVAQITKNPAYMGERVWGKEMRVYKRGHVKIVKAPEENIVRSQCPAIIEGEFWQKVQDINQASTETTWRDAQGHLKSRPTGKASFLLNPFLECWLCHGGMHAKASGKKYRYVCTRRHQKGPLACANKYGMSQEHADAEVLGKFSKALLVEMVNRQINAALEVHKQRAADPEPLKKEMGKIEKEIKNLIEACASGAQPDIKKAIDARRARLEHLDGQVKACGVASTFNLEAFAEGLLPVITDWQKQLNKNPSTAQQALRKLLPGRLVAQRNENGTWTFSGTPDFSALIREVKVRDAVLDQAAAMYAMSKEVKVTATRGCNDQFDSSVSGLVPA